MYSPALVPNDSNRSATDFHFADGYDVCWIHVNGLLVYVDGSLRDELVVEVYPDNSKPGSGEPLKSISLKYPQEG